MNGEVKHMGKKNAEYRRTFSALLYSEVDVRVDLKDRVRK